MPIKLLSEIAHVIISPFENPAKDSKHVEVNIIRLTSRTTLLTGSAAILLTIMSRCLKPGTLPSWPSTLIKASLVCGATSTAIFICSLYQCVKGKNKPPYKNLNTWYFEKGIQYVTVATSATLMIAFTVLKKNKNFGPLAVHCWRHFFIPLAFCGVTAALIEMFHTYQLNQRVDSNTSTQGK